jgi:transcriptional regulator with XRE-family HTH domain
MQLDLAKRAEIAYRRLSEIENGEAEPARDELERIAAVLKVPLKTLWAQGELANA